MELGPGSRRSETHGLIVVAVLTAGHGWMGGQVTRVYLDSTDYDGAALARNLQ